MQEYNQLLSKIGNEEFAPIYLLSGTAPYFIDQIVAALTARLIDEAAQDFDHSVFYGKDASVQQILETVKRYPMIAKYHLVVVKEAQYLSGDLEALATYAKSPLLQTILVYCHKYSMFDKRKKLYKAVQKSGTVMDFKPLYDNQIAGWIQSRANTFDLKMPPAVSALLADCLGADLSKIEKELEKLGLVVSGDREVTTEMIEEHVGFSKDFNNFELQKAIGLRQLSRSFRIIQYMSNNQKNHPLTLTLSTLHAFFKKLLLFHGLPNPSKAAAVLGVNPYFVKDYQQAAQCFNMKQTSGALSLLLEADLKSKGVGAHASSPFQILNELLIKLFAL